MDHLPRCPGLEVKMDKSDSELITMPSVSVFQVICCHLHRFAFLIMSLVSSFVQNVATPPPYLKAGGGARWNLQVDHILHPPQANKGNDFPAKTLGGLHTQEARAEF